MLRAVLRANTVVQRVDAAVRLHPGVVAAPIVLGTLSACGGTLLVDAFRHCAGYKQGGCRGRGAAPDRLAAPLLCIFIAVLLSGGVLSACRCPCIPAVLHTLPAYSSSWAPLEPSWLASSKRPSSKPA